MGFSSVYVYPELTRACDFHAIWESADLKLQKMKSVIKVMYKMPKAIYGLLESILQQYSIFRTHVYSSCWLKELINFCELVSLEQTQSDSRISTVRDITGEELYWQWSVTDAAVSQK